MMYEIATDTPAPLFKYFRDARPVAVQAFTNTFGVVVYAVEGDEVVAAWSGPEGCRGFHRHKIHATAAGRFYIRKGGTRIYFDEMTHV